MIYPYRLMAHYPGLGPDESAVWDDFIRENPNRYDEAWYETLVGGGKNIPHPFTDDDRDLWGEITQKRIDVVLTWEGRLTIVEVKSLTSWTAIGQLLGYQVLLHGDDPKLTIEDLLLVTPYIDTDFLRVCRKLRISHWTPHGHRFWIPRS